MSYLGWNHLTRQDKDDILQGIEDGVAYGGPYHVELHPADRCNIDCFFCSTAALRGKDEIPMPRFEELLGEMREAGTRSMRLSGGGEPLFHRSIPAFLQAIDRSGIPIENLTTNAVLLRPGVAELLARTCEQITISLNTADDATYATMMKTNARNFQRVVDNVKALTASRKPYSKKPHVKIQYLVWKENYRSIPRMYQLAREMGADSILFNGLAYLRPDQQMTPAETDEMMELYQEILRVDEYRRIEVINSFEQDLSQRVHQIERRVGEERAALAPAHRVAKLLTRRDFTLGEKLAHYRKQRRRHKLFNTNGGLDSPCVIGWYSMLVRPTGLVAPCCILQGKQLGNIYQQPLREIWQGEGYRQLRASLARIMRQKATWELDEKTDGTIDPICGPKGNCPIASFYYWPDSPFLNGLNGALQRGVTVNPGAGTGPRRSTPASL
jgi:MoaA/NifB/PqqE/SkfB family radical SAM enzyme